MKNIKTLIASALLLGLAGQTANAQDYSELDYKPYPYAFITLQGGGQLTFTDYKNSKLITPIGAFSVGGMFSPAIGARLNVNGWKTRGGLKSIRATYDYNYINPNLDLMVNLTNIIMPKERVYPVNVYLIGGVGLTYAWDNDDLKYLMKYATEKNLYHAWDDDRLVHNFRAGMQIEANVAKHVGINVELTANNMQDRFNSKVNHRGDWQIQAMAGLTFKFGFKKKPVPAPAPKPEPAPAPAPKPAPVPVPAPKPAPKPAPQVQMKRADVFFKINSSAVNASEEAKLQVLAEWMKNHPNAKIEVTGYADAQTGTASYNKSLSEKRANRVAKILNEKYGIDKDRITVSSKGDTVQPFAENNKNRVVIGIAKD